MKSVLGVRVGVDTDLRGPETMFSESTKLYFHIFYEYTVDSSWEGAAHVKSDMSPTFCCEAWRYDNSFQNQGMLFKLKMRECLPKFFCHFASCMHSIMRLSEMTGSYEGNLGEK